MYITQVFCKLRLGYVDVTTCKNCELVNQCDSPHDKNDIIDALIYTDEEFNDERTRNFSL